MFQSCLYVPWFDRTEAVECGHNWRHHCQSKDVQHIHDSISNIVRTTSDSPIFHVGDGREDVQMSTETFKILDTERVTALCLMRERLRTGWIIRARLLYIGPPATTSLRKPLTDAIFLSEFLIQPLSFDTSGAKQMDLYIMDVWETMHK